MGIKSAFFLLTTVSLFVMSSSAFAIFKEDREDLYETLIGTGIADARDYQIGDEWGKKPVSRDSLRGKTPAFARAAMATARYGGATAFYLGKINGHHMMATNHHVMPNGDICRTRSAVFPQLDPVMQKTFHCEKFYGDWTAIDLALFSITVTDARDEELLAKVGRNFNFNVSLYPGEELITIGFGVFRNPYRELMGNEDSDCKVFSAKDDYRFIADPDRINPADYQTWSFATGCDVSHGDSGSAMVDRNTGDVVGIIWTTATQKEERIRSSAYLDELLKKPNDDVWSWLSYAVPAPKMRDYLRDFLSSARFSDADIPQTIDAVIH